MAGSGGTVKPQQRVVQRPAEEPDGGRNHYEDHDGDNHAGAG